MEPRDQPVEKEAEESGVVAGPPGVVTMLFALTLRSSSTTDESSTNPAPQSKGGGIAGVKQKAITSLASSLAAGAVSAALAGPAGTPAVLAAGASVALTAAKNAGIAAVKEAVTQRLDGPKESGSKWDLGGVPRKVEPVTPPVDESVTTDLAEFVEMLEPGAVVVADYLIALEQLVTEHHGTSRFHARLGPAMSTQPPESAAWGAAEITARGALSVADALSGANFVTVIDFKDRTHAAAFFDASGWQAIRASVTLRGLVFEVSEGPILLRWLTQAWRWVSRMWQSTFMEVVTQDLSTSLDADLTKRLKAAMGMALLNEGPVLLLRASQGLDSRTEFSRVPGAVWRRSFKVHTVYNLDGVERTLDPRATLTILDCPSLASVVLQVARAPLHSTPDTIVPARAIISKL